MSNDQDHRCTCVFFFADGRRCQLPQSPDDAGLCYFHAQKFRDRITAQEAGRQISEFLNTDVLTASDLNSAFTTLFSATARGFIKPKTTAALTYLGQLMLQTQRLAKQEFLESFEDRWPTVVQESVTFNPPDPPPAAESPEPANPDDPTDAPPVPPKIM
jgi:hypothetical protein